ncbi:MAG: TonB-dependent receptor [Bacteroidales bacterium]|nr:TonB-dependent receptor [Bacteroidales bacterium]
MRFHHLCLVLAIAAFLFLPSLAHSQTPPESKKFTISGHVKDASTGEYLIGATIFVSELSAGVITNSYGFYSISLPSGSYQLRFSYIGYSTFFRKVNLAENMVLDIAMESGQSELGEVEIKGTRTDENVRAPEMSLVKLDVKTISRIPALLGEVDIIKAIQLLPGVQSTSEGSTGFSVRGGNSDQNLIILDEATVYNASHLMGFFSVFNNDAIKDVTLYKGDIPAAYGGRLSSLLDVRMKDGNSKQLKLTGGIGTVSSRLTIEGPIIKDRTTFVASGRRTYADLFLPFAKDEGVRDNKLFFYDFNLKLTHTINETNRVYFSGYLGRDTFKNQFAKMGFGNQTASLRWNHLFSSKLFFNASVIYSQFDYNLGTPQGDANSFNWSSKMRDHSARFDFTYYLNTKNTLKYGATTTFHEFFPGTATGLGDESLISEFRLPTQYAFEHGAYVSNEQKVTDKLTLKYGLRLSVFQNVGPGTYYRFDEDFNPIDSVVYKKRDFFNTYFGLEPRLAFTYLLDERSSIKGHYSHTYQYIALAQNSTAGTPLDVWFPSTPNVKPQVADQVAIGYFRNFFDNSLETSVEVYYKKVNKVIDFCDHAYLLLNQYIEGEIRIGEGESYGLELMTRKNSGDLNGWISYTYSRSWRKIETINNGNRYPAPYDKPHTLNIVLNYEASKRVELSATWVYATGLPVTFPTGRALIGNAIVPIYSDRNAYRMPDYHRLDLSCTLKGKEKPGKRWRGDWNLSVYNAYNRKNAWSINFEKDAADPYTTYAVKTYLFSIIPALTYNFKF